MDDSTFTGHMRRGRATERNGTRRVLVRSSLAFLALNAASLGLWATFAPRSWFESFPGAGHSWVGLDGPYNHHLATDVGTLSLALAVVTVAALISGSRPMVRAVGVAWLASAFPHFLYHLSHRGGLPRGDRLASLTGLALQMVLAAMCAVPVPDDGRPPADESVPVTSTDSVTAS